MEDGVIVFAKEFRNKEKLKTCPNDKPGYYKWFAPKESLEKLLNSSYIEGKYLELFMPNLSTKEIDGVTYYYIYVGVAIRESIQRRLDWHINQKYRISSVESGYLSTLRQSLASLISGNQYDEVGTNKFVDSLVVEYYPVEAKIKSKRAKNYISKIEQKELKDNLLPINIKDNKNKLVGDYLKELKWVRKNSK